MPKETTNTIQHYNRSSRAIAGNTSANGISRPAPQPFIMGTEADSIIQRMPPKKIASGKKKAVGKKKAAAKKKASDKKKATKRKKQKAATNTSEKGSGGAKRARITGKGREVNRYVAKVAPGEESEDDTVDERDDVDEAIGIGKMLVADDRKRTGPKEDEKYDDDDDDEKEGKTERKTPVVEYQDRRAATSTEPVRRAMPSSSLSSLSLTSSSSSSSSSDDTHGFYTLNYLQQEQILAVAQHILTLARPIFERALADHLRDTYGDVYGQINKAVTATASEVPTLSSERDQSKTFNLNIKSTNARFGGSVRKVATKKVKGGIERESALNGDEFRVDSHYAEASRSANNYVSKGPNASLSAVLSTLENMDLNRWPLFAFMYQTKNMTLFETFSSIRDLFPPLPDGPGIYTLVPSPFLKAIGWKEPPNYLLSPGCLNIMSKGLYHSAESLHSLDELFPDEITELIKSAIRNLSQPQKKVRADSDKDAFFNRIPPVILDELSDEQTASIKGIKSKKAYTAHKKAFKDNIAAYLVLTMIFAEKYEPKKARWFQSARDVLMPPELRTTPLAKPAVPKSQQNTLRKNVKKVATHLGDYDFGASTGDKEEHVNALMENNIGGAHKISKYISGGFGKFSDVLDAPANREDDQSAIDNVQSATDGLEALPVHEGWAYRLESEVTDHEPGQIISPGVLWSASSSPRFGIQFDKTGKGDLYVIKCLHTGKDVQLLAGALKWYQREILFPPYARFVVENKRIRGKKKEQGSIYIMKELAPAGKPFQPEDLDTVVGSDPGETTEVQTLVDKRHYNKAAAKYSRHEAWGASEAHRDGIENLRSGIHHPREIYGLQTFRKWQALLRKKEDAPGLDALWTVDGLLGVATELTGHKNFRNHFSGWGDDTSTYELTQPQIDALLEKNITVNAAYKEEDLIDDWERELTASLIKTIKKEIKEKTRFTVNVADINTIGDALKDDAEPRYEVYYPYSEREEIRSHLIILLAKYKNVLAGKRTTFNRTSPTSDGPKAFNKEIAGLAANLQQDIVACHPFDDGNGRISRMYMYKVLQHFLISDDADRLPVIENTGNDLGTSRAEWASMLGEKIYAKK
ncbi:Fic family protein [Chitinophaga oryziterrae]|nr:Fic family protein [Chitinophaga oryziterrae]